MRFLAASYAVESENESQMLGWGGDNLGPGAANDLDFRSFWAK